jgi:hypothetical protein
MAAQPEGLLHDSRPWDRAEKPPQPLCSMEFTRFLLRVCSDFQHADFGIGPCERGGTLVILI